MTKQELQTENNKQRILLIKLFSKLGELRSMILDNLEETSKDDDKNLVKSLRDLEI